MSGTVRTLAVLAILVLGFVGATIYVPSLQLGRSGSGTTVTSTTSTSCTTASSTSATSTRTTSTMLNGTFTAFQTSPIRVDSVQAQVFPGQGGSQFLVFRVGFTNVGTSAIYVVAGCGSSLNSTITSGGDVVRTTIGGTRCLCAEYMAPVDSQQSHTSSDPGCWSGYGYFVQKSGSFSASLSLYWSDAPQFTSSNHLKITATFTVP